jgi:hypothetical protein
VQTGLGDEVKIELVGQDHAHLIHTAGIQNEAGGRIHG